MEVYAALESLKHAKKHVRRWMKRDARRVPMPLPLLGARARIEYQPKGVVGILGTWNFPLSTTFSPLAGVLAAGNRTMIKFSELSPATADCMRDLVSSAFDETEVACVTGGPEVGAAFSSLPFDHLCFTGSPSVGKLVMRAAAENLTPVTLELGGKSPVIIARDADLERRGGSDHDWQGPELRPGLPRPGLRPGRRTSSWRSFIRLRDGTGPAEMFPDACSGTPTAAR